MPGMSTNAIKGEFLDFYQSNDHELISESGIVPKNDPTLLYINSGMAPLKPYFTGEAQPPSRELTNSQLCIRTTDIESVGDPHHGTSFNMLGSWSIGGYRQERAVDLAWELLTTRLGFKGEDLSATFFSSDEGIETAIVPTDEASQRAWRRYLLAHQVIGMPAEDNLWGPAGTSGPFGPCTEVFYDRGEAFGPRTPGELTDGRDIEIWNAGVFMQYFKDEDGHVTPLKLKSVDAGAGLERIAMVLQNAPSIHEIDVHAAVFEALRSEMGAANDDDNTRRTRVVFDHLGTANRILDSGVFPSNTKEGYVLRRLLRRAFSEIQMAGLAVTAARTFSDMIRENSSPTPETITDPGSSMQLIQAEIGRFEAASKRAAKYFKLIDAAGEIHPNTVFKAHTQDGVPIEIFRTYARTQGLVFPESDIARLEFEHRQKSKM